MTIMMPAPAGRETRLPGIAFTRFRLDNGLTVIAHEDRKAPIVAMALWYRVGSGDEPAGRHGFAHLFEHLMFSGSEHHRRPYHDGLLGIGATDLNGTTWFDRTNYFATLPTPAIDLALWLESDRMGHLLGAVDQHKLDMQRDIIRNEKLQTEGRPYGKLAEIMQRNAYPADHPYAHTTIGSMADLAESSLDDVAAWFRSHYGAANATLVLAGDIAPEEARAKAARYFGDIAPGPAVAHPLPWIPRRPQPARGEIHDRVPDPIVQRQWNGPQWGHADGPLLELAASIMTGGVTSRLHRRLVRDAQVATNVGGSFPRLAVVRPFTIRIGLAAEDRLAEAEALLDAEWQGFLADGPDIDEVERARNAAAAAFTRGIECVGGMDGKAARLAEGAVLRGAPDARHADIAAMFDATPATIAAAARRWIDRSHYTLVVRPLRDGGDPRPAIGTDGWAVVPGRPQPAPPPAPAFAAAAHGADRSAGPPIVPGPAAGRFPEVEEAILDNGLRLLVARRPASPVTFGVLDLGRGSGGDPADLPGLATFGGLALFEGTAARNAVDFAGDLDRLGVNLAAQTRIDTTGFLLDTPAYAFGEAVGLLKDLLCRPAFDAAAVDHVRRRMALWLRQLRADPGRLGRTILPTLLFGRDHPYGRAGAGSGTAAGLAAITADRLRSWHRHEVRMAGASLAICGDLGLDQVAEAFADIAVPETGRGDEAGADRMPAPPPAPRVVLIDMPGAGQSAILGGLAIPRIARDDAIAAVAANAILGGSFESRLNMNLREDKQWAYGADSSMATRRGPGMILLSAAVQQDRTGDALREMLREVAEIGDQRPPRAEEVQRFKAQLLHSLPARFEPAQAIAFEIANSARHGYPPDWTAGLGRRAAALGEEAVAAAARRLFASAAMTWLVVGDAAAIAADVARVCGGEVERLDPATLLG